MNPDQSRVVLPPQGCGITDWSEVELRARRRYARRCGRSTDDPDVLDYGQEVFLRTYRNCTERPEQYDTPAKFLKMFQGVMKNVALESGREVGHRLQPFSEIGDGWEGPVSNAPSPDLFGWREDFEVIRAAVQARCHDSTYEAFNLLHFEGLSVADVSERLGITHQAVYSARFNVLGRFVEEESFLQLDRLIYELRDEPCIRRAIAEVRSRCPRQYHAWIDRVYGGPTPGRFDPTSVDSKAFYQARAALFRELQPVLNAICRREEGIDEL